MKPISFTSPIRLLLVDDHPILRAGLANLLSMDAEITIVAQADDGESALQLWQQHQPDVTLLDINMIGIDGIETLRRLRTISLEAKVLMLTSSEAEEDARHALKQGACGYMIKNIRGPELIAAIKTVHHGGKYIGESMRKRLEEQTGSRHLSMRETEVLGLIRQGFTNREIGNLLGISERTARAHVAAIMEKLGASDRAAAVGRGFECGILKT